MTLEYAKKCREAYSLGKEKEYIKCILDSADEFAERNPRGTDKHTVIRGTKALVELQSRFPAGVPREAIRERAGFTTYKGTGLWPWLNKPERIEVVKNTGGAKYVIVNQFRQALVDTFSCGGGNPVSGSSS